MEYRAKHPACYDLDGVSTDTVVIDDIGRIVAGDDRGRIAVMQYGRLQFHQAHQAGIKKLVYSENQRLLPSLRYDRTLAFWHVDDSARLTEQHRIGIPDMVWPRAAAILGSDRLLAGTFGSRYAIYDLSKRIWKTNGIEIGKSINAVTYQRGHVYTVGDAGILRKDGSAIRDLGSLCNFLLPVKDRLFAGGQLGRTFH